MLIEFVNRIHMVDYQHFLSDAPCAKEFGVNNVKAVRHGNRQGSGTPFAVPLNIQLFGYHQWCEAQRRLNKSWNMEMTKGITKICPIVERVQSIQTVDLTAIIDIDAAYFTDLAGRPITEKFSRYRYIERILNVLRTGILTGYERDECLKLNQRFTQEKIRLGAIERQHRYYSSAFEEYLSNDHEISMKTLNDAHEETRKSNELAAKRDVLFNKFSQVRLEVYECEEMWRIAKMCYKFFRKITSTSSQLTTQEALSFKTSGKKSSERSSILGTLECLIEAFEEDISNDYVGIDETSLRDSHELSRIFAAIEQRNLDALIHLESLAGPIAEMTTNLVRAEELVGGEIKLIEDSLEELKSLIDVSEQRSTKLECYADYLLYEVFQKLVCSNSVLQLRVFTENTYESCVGPNDANLDSYSMMRVIEKTYESLNMSLDSLPYEIVKTCEKEGFAQEMRTMREAEDAARKFDLMHRLLVALERIMDPPYSDPTLKLEPKSVTRNIKPKLKSSALKSADKIRMKSYPQSSEMQESSRRLFNKKCLSINLDISNELTMTTQNALVHELSTGTSPGTNNEEDCRDGMSQNA